MALWVEFSATRLGEFRPTALQQLTASSEDLVVIIKSEIRNKTERPVLPQLTLLVIPRTCC